MISSSLRLPLAAAVTCLASLFAAGPAVTAVGVMFAGLWVAAYLIGMKIDRERAIG